MGTEGSKINYVRGQYNVSIVVHKITLMFCLFCWLFLTPLDCKYKCVSELYFWEPDLIKLLFFFVHNGLIILKEP